MLSVKFNCLMIHSLFLEEKCYILHSLSLWFNVNKGITFMHWVYDEY